MCVYVFKDSLLLGEVGRMEKEGGWWGRERLFVRTDHVLGCF